jgi:hypothetical protein
MMRLRILARGIDFGEDVDVTGQDHGVCYLWFVDY